jgi:hypothetical protein
LKEEESINGQTVVNLMANGRIIKCMVKVYLLGLMEDVMKESTLKTRNRDSVHSIGQMAENILDNGTMENNMAKEHL